MDIMIDMGPGTWADWIAKFPDADDDIKLAALRNYIEQAAREYLASDPDKVTPEWLNKKLPQVGVTARFDAVSTYTLRVPVGGYYTTEASAPNRAEAERLFLATVGSRVRVDAPTITGPVVFTAGPEDPTPCAMLDDAPTTVEATLAKLREILLLGVIAGPRFCDTDTNEVLSSFGLAPVPDRKRFVVTRPVEGFASTTVEAFDEASALRVAEWRWRDRTGWAVDKDDAAAAGALTAVEKP